MVKIYTFNVEGVEYDVLLNEHFNLRFVDKQSRHATWIRDPLVNAVAVHLRMKYNGCEFDDFHIAQYIQDMENILYNYNPIEQKLFINYAILQLDSDIETMINEVHEKIAQLEIMRDKKKGVTLNAEI